jgi:hypothetical protein
MKIGSSWLMGTTATPSPFWGPAVTRTSRGVYECLVSVVLAIGVITFATIAQDSPPDDGDDDVEIVDWDLSDPVNHAESREFFAGRWAAEGAGLPAPDFEFTNTPPGLMFAMLLPELEVFTEIYRHRLQLDFDAGERYLATNLIAADADIRAEFRAFVLTGKLAPRPEIDAGAYLAHYMLVLDAVTAQERASVVSVEVFGALVESEGMSVEAPPPASATVHQTFPPPNPTDQEAECWLKQAVKSSRLNKCLKGLYDRTRQVGPPDMDCDDFADAFIRYLQRVMPPGWSSHYGIVAWRCKKRLPDGSIQWLVSAHAVSVFRDPRGKWWFVDPRLARVRGPYDSERALIEGMNGAYTPNRDCRRNVPGYADHIRPISDDIVFGLDGESKPWWQNPTRRRALCEALQACCGQPLTNSTGAPCPLPSWAPPFPSGCDIGHYLPEPVPAWDDAWGPLEDCTAAGPQ